MPEVSTEAEAGVIRAHCDGSAGTAPRLSKKAKLYTKYNHNKTSFIHNGRSVQNTSESEWTITTMCTEGV